MVGGRFGWKGGGVVLGIILGGGMDSRMFPSGCGCPLSIMSVTVVLRASVAVVVGATGFVGWLGWSMVGSWLGSVGCCWFVVGLVVLWLGWGSWWAGGGAGCCVGLEGQMWWCYQRMWWWVVLVVWLVG